MFEHCALRMRKYYDIIHLPWIFGATTYYIKCSVPRPPKNEEFFMIPHEFTSHAPSCKIYLLNLRHYHGTLNGILCSPRPLLGEWHPLGTWTINKVTGKQNHASLCQTSKDLEFETYFFPQFHLKSLLNMILLDLYKKLRPTEHVFGFIEVGRDWFWNTRLIRATLTNNPSSADSIWSSEGCIDL